MKKIIISLLLIMFSFVSKAQTTMTQTYVDRCSGEVKVATITYVNGNAFVSFYDQVRTFTPLEVQAGAMQSWLQATYIAYSARPCPTNIVVQQTVQQTVTQATQAATSAAASAAASAASNAASSAASGAASSAANNAASSAASGTASSATSGAASSAASGGTSSAGTTSNSTSNTGSSSSGGN
jgi:hypothetical protein